MHCSSSSLSGHAPSRHAFIPHKATRQLLHYPHRVHCASDARSTNCSYIIRAVQPADVQQLAAIEESCAEFSAGWGASDIEAEFSKDVSLVLVAAERATDSPLGYIVCWLVAGELQVLELAVDPAHQSQGIGSALLTNALESTSEGAVLEVKAHNQRAIQLYKRHGFIETGMRKKFYPCGSDAVLMARMAQSNA